MLIAVIVTILLLLLLFYALTPKANTSKDFARRVLAEEEEDLVLARVRANNQKLEELKNYDSTCHFGVGCKTKENAQLVEDDDGYFDWYDINQ